LGLVFKSVHPGGDDWSRKINEINSICAVLQAAVSAYSRADLLLPKDHDILFA
jgi:hypothetical protein